MVYARVCIVCDICKGSEYNTFLEGGRSLRSFGPQAHTAIPMYNLGKEPSDHNHLCIYVYVEVHYTINIIYPEPTKP